ncbi:MAG: hydrolase [Christensenellales bacterium]|jgi:2-keto-3-deoxy-6-phosphogluconate aldolase
MKQNVPVITGQLRKHMIIVPPEIEQVSGICIFGKLIKSLVFTTDVAIIRNINADAVIAVYPFTPQPAITHSIMMAAEMPVFCGVGGGTTKGKRVINLARDAEFQGAIGVVVNAPTPNETLSRLSEVVDIPIVITVVSEYTDIAARLKAGASILNVSGAARTPYIVESIRKKFPDVPIIATGGSTPESIRRTIEAGANAITYTPPTTAELFREMMIRYREDCEEEHRDILSKPDL